MEPTDKTPIFVPHSGWSALLFAALPCVCAEYRPLFSLLFHVGELEGCKTDELKLPSLPHGASLLELLRQLFPNLEQLSRSLSFYAEAFHQPFLSTLATLLELWNLSQANPGLFTSMVPQNNAFTTPSDETDFTWKTLSEEERSADSSKQE